MSKEILLVVDAVSNEKGVESGSALLEVDGEVWQLPLNDIAVARLVPA